MSKILVTSDDETTRVQIMTIDDPTDPFSDEARDPIYAAQCRTPGCVWNSFVDEGTIHIRESDAINDAEMHLDEHEHAEA